MRALMGLSVIALAAGSGTAGEPAQVITVTGTGTVHARADGAVVHYSVRATDVSLDAAKELAAKRVSSVDQAVKGLKIAGLSTTSGAISFLKLPPPRVLRFNPGGGNQPPPQPTYVASVPFTATITEKNAEKLRAAVDEFVKKAADNGAAIVGDGIESDASGVVLSSRLDSRNEGLRVEWILSNDADARREAYRRAVRQAKADAETLAAELGWEKPNIVSIADGPSSVQSTERSVFGRDTAQSRTPEGEVAVTVRVAIKCSR